MIAGRTKESSTVENTNGVKERRFFERRGSADKKKEKEKKEKKEKKDKKDKKEKKKDG